MAAFFIKFLFRHHSPLCEPECFIYLAECALFEPLRKTIFFVLVYVFTCPLEQVCCFAETASALVYFLYTYMVIEVFVVVYGGMFDLIDSSIYGAYCTSLIFGLFPVIAGVMVDEPACGAEVRECMEVSRMFCCEGGH
jgi:hypothetical protein